MPVVTFRVRWPDGTTERCFSPSRAVAAHLEAGRSYALEDFLARARAALEEGSRRVAAKYGFACSASAEQLQALERRAAALGPEQRRGRVAVLALEGLP